MLAQLDGTHRHRLGLRHEQLLGIRPVGPAERRRGKRLAGLRLEVRDETDRPQTRLDRETGGGMAAVVGRVRACPVLTLRFVVLSHNTVRGAAGGALLNAELLAARGLVRERVRA